MMPRSSEKNLELTKLKIMKALLKDKVQKIPAGLEKYLGKGEMVLPSRETVMKELQNIPEGKLITIPVIRESIAEQFGVTTTCPKTCLKIAARSLWVPSFTRRGLMEKCWLLQ